jgi:hypothetical protein
MMPALRDDRLCRGVTHTVKRTLVLSALIAALFDDNDDDVDTSYSEGQWKLLNNARVVNRRFCCQQL